MMKRILSISLFLLFVVSSSIRANDKLVADSLYTAGQYPKAAQLYEKMLKSGDNAIVYYNLGNTYYRMNNLAKAILNYERAANREPGDSDIRFNLTLARSKTIDKIESTDDFFLIYWFRSFVNSMNTDQWGRASVVAFALLLISILVFVFGRKLLFRKIGFSGAIIFFICMLIFNLFAYIQRKQYLDNTHAIVMQSASVKSTPSQTGTSLFQLHEGTKVKILDQSIRQWVEVQLSDGKTGWMLMRQIEMI